MDKHFDSQGQTAMMGRPPDLRLVPRLLNRKQTADYLGGVSVDYVRKLTYEGKLEVTKLGRRCLYDRKKLDLFIERSTQKLA